MQGNGRVLVLVDCQQLFYSARELSGEWARLDYQKLDKRVAELVHGRDVVKVAFVAVSDQFDSSRFVTMLKALGYRVKKKYVNLAAAAGGDGIRWSEWMTGEIPSLLTDPYAAFVIASGSGGFLRLVESLVGGDNEVTMLSFKNRLNASFRALTPVVELGVEDLLEERRREKDACGTAPTNSTS